MIKATFNELNELRNSSSVINQPGVLYLVNDSLSYRVTEKGSLIILSDNYSLVVSKRQITLSDYDTYSYAFPYNCEDKNEFFQLSTMYDYGDITYEDLCAFHMLCEFLIKRYNEKIKESNNV